ncbi:MAG TPA: hypothetical protein VKH81_03510 [Candidatus Angelobacter sp.]|nr:hypothetical protein [Candidatus Angelobacter sp.]
MHSPFAQRATGRPKFSDYPVVQIYQGKPAVPILSKDQRWYRTVIREGAKSKVQFAGHYTVPIFGCGAGCAGFYLVDSITGKVYDGFTVADSFAWIARPGNENVRRIEFYPNSRLFRITGCPGETNCGFYDYEVVDGAGLKLVYKKLLSQEFQ